MATVVAAPARAATTDQLVDAARALRARLTAAGIAGTVDVDDDQQAVVVQLVAADDVDRTRRLLDPGEMQIRPVLGLLDTAAGDCREAALDPDNEAVACEAVRTDPADPTSDPLPSERWTRWRLGPAQLGSRDLDAVTITGEGDTSQVLLTFTADGADLWAQLTGEAPCMQGPGRQVAIIVDGRVVTAPPLAYDIECGVGLTGGEAVIHVLARGEAIELASLLRDQLAIPLQVHYVQQP